MFLLVFRAATTNLHIEKLASPDLITPITRRHSAEQLSPVFRYIFNQSLHQCTALACFKTSANILVAKKPKITSFTNYKKCFNFCSNKSI